MGHDEAIQRRPAAALTARRGPVVAIVEAGGSHAECLYSQCRFLADRGCEVHLLVHRDIAPRVRGYADRCEVLPAVDDGILGAETLRRAVTGYVRRLGIRHLVVNTASGWGYRLLVLHLATQVRITAIVHDIGRLRRSLLQRLTARRLANVLVLADRLEAPCRDLCGNPVSAFYPAWFPPVAAGSPHVKPAGERWFAVVGQIEAKRRSYDELIRLAEHGLDERARILVLGRPSGDDGREILRRLRCGSASGRFLFFDGFVPDDTLHSLVSRCDGILPLTEGRQRYVASAVSGVHNLAYGYRLPLLLGAPTGDPTDELGRCSLVAEPGEGIGGLIARVCERPALLAAASTSIAGDARLSFARSRDRYVGAVLGGDWSPSAA